MLFICSSNRCWWNFGISCLLLLVGLSGVACAESSNSEKLTWQEFYQAEKQAFHAIRRSTSPSPARQEEKEGDPSELLSVIQKHSAEAARQLTTGRWEELEPAVRYGLESRLKDKLVENPSKSNCHFGSQPENEDCITSSYIPGTIEYPQAYQEDWGLLLTIEYQLNRLLQSIKQGDSAQVRDIMRTRPGLRKEVFILDRSQSRALPSGTSTLFDSTLFGYINISLGMESLPGNKESGTYQAYLTFLAEGGMLYSNQYDDPQMLSADGRTDKIHRNLSSHSFLILRAIIRKHGMCQLTASIKGSDLLSEIDQANLQMLPAPQSGATQARDIFLEEREKFFNWLFAESIRESEYEACYINAAVSMQRRTPAGLADTLMYWILYDHDYHGFVMDWEAFDLNPLVFTEHLEDSLLYKAVGRNSLAMLAMARSCSHSSDGQCEDLQESDLDAVNSQEETLVFHALRKGHLKMARHLIQSDVNFDPAMVNHQGQTFLKAHLDDHGSKEQELVSWLADYFRDQSDGKLDTLLHLAAYSNSIMLARQALAMGLQPLQKNAEGMTPVDLAFQMKHYEILTLLLTKVPDDKLVLFDNSILLAGLYNQNPDLFAKICYALRQDSSGSGRLRLNNLLRELPDTDRLLMAVPNNSFALLDDDVLLGLMDHQRSDLPVKKVRQALLRDNSDSGLQRLNNLAQALVDNQRQESARVLMAGNPCPLYQQASAPNLMQTLCQVDSSADDIAGLIASQPFGNPEESWLFGMSPLHVAAMLSGQRGKARQFRAVLDFMVSESRDGLSAPDHNNKTVGHYLVDNGQHRLLFHWLLNADNANWPGTGRLYPDLITHALEKESLEAVSLLQLFWIPVYPLLPKPAYGHKIYETLENDIEKSCRSGNSATQYAARTGKLDWVTQYYPPESSFFLKRWLGYPSVSPLDQLLGSTRCDGYHQPGNRFFMEVADIVSNSRVLTGAGDADSTFDFMAEQLAFGANPNEAFPSHNYQNLETVVAKIGKEYLGNKFAQNIALAIIFGADIKEQYIFDTATDISGFDDVKRVFLEPYRQALVNPDKSNFRKATDRFRQTAVEVMEQLDLKGRLSLVHPVCTCLTLQEKEGASTRESFTPWCQVKADKPGAHFSNQLRTICEEYGYTPL